jgi:hypothetical protein
MADLFGDHAFEPLLAQMPNSSFGVRRGKCPVSPMARTALLPVRMRIQIAAERLSWGAIADWFQPQFVDPGCSSDFVVEFQRWLADDLDLKKSGLR